MTLPYSQQRVLDYCRSEVNAGRPLPHVGKIASHMGWKVAGPVRSILEALEREGYLIFTKDRRFYALADEENQEKRTA